MHQLQRIGKWQGTLPNKQHRPPLKVLFPFLAALPALMHSISWQIPCPPSSLCAFLGKVLVLPPLRPPPHPTSPRQVAPRSTLQPSQLPLALPILQSPPGGQSFSLSTGVTGHRPRVAARAQVAHRTTFIPTSLPASLLSPGQPILGYCLAEREKWTDVRVHCGHTRN